MHNFLRKKSIKNNKTHESKQKQEYRVQILSVKFLLPLVSESAASTRGFHVRTSGRAGAQCDVRVRRFGEAVHGWYVFAVLSVLKDNALHLLPCSNNLSLKSKKYKYCIKCRAVLIYGSLMSSLPEFLFPFTLLSQLSLDHRFALDRWRWR